jgi:hypothetical protein
MAFDDDSYADIASVRAHLHAFAAQTFGAEHADAVSDILWRYYDLAFSRKPEFMGFNTHYPTTSPRQTDYNMLDFGDENARRVEAYRDIAARAGALMHILPKDRQDSFYELVAYPAGAAAAINERTLDLDKAIAYGLQRRASANLYADQARAAQAVLVAGEATYNTTLAGGKWRGMMDIAPAKLPQYSEPAFPIWSGKDGKTCAVQAEGGSYYDIGGATPALPPFQRELPRSRYVDLFLKSPVSATWTATASAPWIRIDRSKGSFDAKMLEQRLHVSIDWKTAPDNGQGTVTLSCEGTPTTFPVAIRIAPRNTATNVSFLESGRIVSIYATHADALTGGWEVLTGLGHTGASLRSKLDIASNAGANAPSATYRFATVTIDDRAALRVIALPILPVTSQNGMRVAVSIDGAAPVTLDFKTSEFSAAWRQNVLTNSAVGTVGDLRHAAGPHTLKVTALDPGIVLDRFEIAFDGAPRAYDPVPETRIAP